MKRIVYALGAALLALSLTACGGIKFNEETMDLVQLSEPTEGQDMAIFTTSYGVIKVVLYPDRCPNTVENFKALVEEGYYDNQVVFAVETGTYFMAGSHAEDGTDAKTITGKAIKNEVHQDLWPFSGALCAIGNKEGYSDSRYFFCGDIGIDEEMVSGMAENMYPQKAIDGFNEKGGVPGIAMTYTVFGQTIEGFDVIEKILSVKNAGNTDGEESAQSADGAAAEDLKPVEDIVIEKVELSNYTAN